MDCCRRRLDELLSDGCHGNMDHAEPFDVIPPPPSAREKEVLRHMSELPPEDPRDWTAYISGTDESVRVSHAFTRRYQLKDLEDRHPVWLDRYSRLRGLYSWRKVFAGRVLAKRLSWCMSSINSVDAIEAQELRLRAVADALPGVDPCYRQVVAQVLADFRRRYRHMVRAKVIAGDRAWAKAVYPRYAFLADHILDEATAAGDSELVCQLVPLMSPGFFPHSGGHKVFDALDAERLVAAVRSSRVRLSWHDALANHRQREARRLADPSVPPLPPSFYEMVLEMNGPSTVCYHFHHDVMSALDVLVEMHRDGRVDRASLDRTRDRIFADAASRGAGPSYSYLLEDSGRLVTERFSAAVIPFALAKRKAGNM